MYAAGSAGVGLYGEQETMFALKEKRVKASYEIICLICSM